MRFHEDIQPLPKIGEEIPANEMAVFDQISSAEDGELQAADETLDNTTGDFLVIGAIILGAIFLFKNRR